MERKYHRIRTKKAFWWTNTITDFDIGSNCWNACYFGQLSYFIKVLRRWKFTAISRTLRKIAIYTVYIAFVRGEINAAHASRMIAAVTNRIRLVNTSLCYRRLIWIRQLIRYICKFVDTWTHSYWAVKYDSSINNDNLGPPIMPKLRGHGHSRAKVKQWLSLSRYRAPKFSVCCPSDKTFQLTSLSCSMIATNFDEQRLDFLIDHLPSVVRIVYFIS